MYKKIISYFIAFFLFICMFIVSSLAILLSTIFCKQYLLEILETNSYYESIYYSIKDDFSNYVMQSGIDESDIEGILNVEQVKEDVKNLLDKIYDNKAFTVSTDKILEKLDNRINEILEKNNRIPEKDEKEAIKIFEDTISNVYIENIVYSEKYIDNVKDIFLRVKDTFKVVIITVTFIILTLLVIILIINRNTSENIKIISTSLIACGILAISIKLLIKNRIQNILILSAPFSKTIISLLNSIIDIFLTFGIIAVSIGLIAIIISNIKRREL